MEKLTLKYNNLGEELERLFAGTDFVADIETEPDSNSKWEIYVLNHGKIICKITVAEEYYLIQVTEIGYQKETNYSGEIVGGNFFSFTVDSIDECLGEVQRYNSFIKKQQVWAELPTVQLFDSEEFVKKFSSIQTKYPLLDVSGTDRNGKKQDAVWIFPKEKRENNVWFQFWRHPMDHRVDIVAINTVLQPADLANKQLIHKRNSKTTTLKRYWNTTKELWDFLIPKIEALYSQLLKQHDNGL